MAEVEVKPPKAALVAMPTSNGPLSKPLASWSPFSVGLQYDLLNSQVVDIVVGYLTQNATLVVNTIRGISMDGKVFIFYMIGLLSCEKDRDPKDSCHSMVRFAELLLDVFGILHARMEGSDDVKLILEYYRKSRER